MMQPKLKLLAKESIKTQHDVVISYRNNKPLSLFSDDLWDLSPYVENMNCKRSDKQIDFDIILPHGDKLIEGKYTELLSSCKAFLYARMTRPHPRSGKVAKARTIVGLWYRIRPLLYWMIERGIVKFSEINPEIANLYKTKTISLGLAENTVNKRLSILEMLYFYSEFYPDAVCMHPWPNETSIAISGDRKTSNTLKKQALIIPDSIFKRLGSIAIRLIEVESKRILDAKIECNKILESYRGKAIKRIDSGEYKVRSDKREFQIIQCSTSAMKRSLENTAHKFKFSSYSEINEEIILLQTAGYIICAMFSGLRDSELASLEIGAFKAKRELDDETYHWLHGKTYKLEEVPKDVKWMVPPCVGKAVYVLENIASIHITGLRNQLDYLQDANINGIHDREIDELTKYSKCLFLTKGMNKYSYRCIDNETANKRLRRFINVYKIHTDNNQPWPLSTHQFRRTFAVFVAKNLIGDLRYLRHHFKHWSMDMTLHYARTDTSDETLISEIMSEREQINREIVSGWLSGDTQLAGGRGQAIMTFRSRNEIKTAKNLPDAVSKIADGLFIRSTGHSWCMTNTESCGGQGLYDSIHCTTCKNAVIDKSLVSVWRGIKAHEEEILAMDDAGEPVIHHAKQKIYAAEKIIKELTGE